MLVVVKTIRLPCFRRDQLHLAPVIYLNIQNIIPRRPTWCITYPIIIMPAPPRLDAINRVSTNNQPF
jgi:hypothetical protein